MGTRNKRRRPGRIGSILLSLTLLVTGFSFALVPSSPAQADGTWFSVMHDFAPRNLPEWKEAHKRWRQYYQYWISSKDSYGDDKESLAYIYTQLHIVHDLLANSNAFLTGASGDKSFEGNWSTATKALQDATMSGTQNLSGDEKQRYTDFSNEHDANELAQALTQDEQDLQTREQQSGNFSGAASKDSASNETIVQDVKMISNHILSGQQPQGESEEAAAAVAAIQDQSAGSIPFHGVSYRSYQGSLGDRLNLFIRNVEQAYGYAQRGQRIDTTYGVGGENIYDKLGFQGCDQGQNQGVERMNAYRTRLGLSAVPVEKNPQLVEQACKKARAISRGHLNHKAHPNVSDMRSLGVFAENISAAQLDGSKVSAEQLIDGFMGDAINVHAGDTGHRDMILDPYMRCALVVRGEPNSRETTSVVWSIHDARYCSNPAPQNQTQTTQTAQNQNQPAQSVGGNNEDVDPAVAQAQSDAAENQARLQKQKLAEQQALQRQARQSQQPQQLTARQRWDQQRAARAAQQQQQQQQQQAQEPAQQPQQAQAAQPSQGGQDTAAARFQNAQQQIYGTLESDIQSFYNDNKDGAEGYLNQSASIATMRNDLGSDAIPASLEKILPQLLDTSRSSIAVPTNTRGLQRVNVGSGGTLDSRIKKLVKGLNNSLWKQIKSDMQLTNAQVKAAQRQLQS